MGVMDAFNKKQAKAEILRGETLEGTFEDGNPMTPQIQEVLDTRQELVSERQGKELVLRKNNVPAKEGKTIKTDLLNIPKACDQCYLMDKCPQYKPNHSCYYLNDVNINDPSDLLEIVKMTLEMQTQRVMFGRVIEQMEGSYIDKNLSDEMKRLFEYMKMFKELSAPHDSGEGIEIKVKGNAATEVAKQGGGGLLASLFGGGN